MIIVFSMGVLGEKYFPPIVSCQVYKINIVIKEKLTKEQLEMFHKTISGPLVIVKMDFNGQLIHHFLLREIPEERGPLKMCFSILGKKVFIQREFNMVAGLWRICVIVDEDYDGKQLRKLLFGPKDKKV